MKKYLFFLGFFSVTFSFYAYVPFNQSFDINCTYETIGNGLKGTIQMFQQAKNKNNQPIKNKFTLVLHDYFSNAKREIDGLAITIYDKNWNPTKYTLNKEQTWMKWDEEDRNYNRLFRYFIFYDVMGIMEEKFRKLSKKCQKKYRKSDFVRRQAALGKQEDFSLKTIGDLEKEFEMYKKNNKLAEKPGRISLLDFYEIWQQEGLMKAFEKTDIRALQEKNPGAWFQLASNFDCLEGGVANDGLEHMNRAPVQGENAVATTMGAGIMRAYFIDPDDRNLLRNFSTDHQYKEDDITKIAVGIHKNVVVTSGYYPPFVRTSDDMLSGVGAWDETIVNKGKENEFKRKNYIDVDKQIIKNKKDVSDIKSSNKTIDKDRLEFLFKNKLVSKDRNPVYVFNKEIKKDTIKITQVFTAALNLNEVGFSKEEIQNAKIILKAMYKGTVLAASLGGCKTLFLTLVGAGAFGNEIKWIMDALDDPLIIEAIRVTGMEVFIVLFHDIRGGRSINDKKFDQYQNDKIGMMGALDGIKMLVEHLNRNIKNNYVDIFAQALHVIK